MAFGVSLIYNFVCANYFDVGRTNILYSACFFLAGGLIYLYREQIVRFNQWIVLGLTWSSIVLYYIIDGYSVMCLLVSSLLLMYAVLKMGGVIREQSYKIFQRNQYGNLSFSYVPFSCD